MNITTQTTLAAQLKSLGLSGMPEALIQQEQQPALYVELSFHERFTLLPEHEIYLRHQRKIQRLTGQAKFRLKAHPEHIDYVHPRGLDKAQVRSLREGHWLTHYQNIIITGATGCGKTYRACAIGHYFCQQTKAVRYFRLKTLFEQLQQARVQHTTARLMKQVTAVPILILDDGGLEPLDATQRSDLLEIMDARYDDASTVINAQIPIEHWYQIIGESTPADATLDRVVHRAIKIPLKGESMRKKTQDDYSPSTTDPQS